MFRFINPYRQTPGLPRRDFLRVGGYGLGSLAAGSLLGLLRRNGTHAGDK